MQNVNKQPIEAQDRGDGQTLDVHSIFFTLQGEGPLTGRACVFLRLAGCNLQCPMCDTEYTQGRRHMPVAEILNDIAREWATNTKSIHPLVVITGGEPTRQNLDVLIREFLDVPLMEVQIESNGVLAPSSGVLAEVIGGNVYYIVSPKTSRIADETRYATAFKYVVSADSVSPDDGLPLLALGHKAKPYVARPPAGYTGPIYINPADENDLLADRANLHAARDAAMKYGYIAGVQLHKLFDIP